MSYQSLIVNAERIAVGSGLQQENIFGMIDHNTHFRFPHFSILYLSYDVALAVVRQRRSLGRVLKLIILVDA